MDGEKSLTLKVLELVRDNPGVSARELAELLSISQELARSIVARLKSKGLIKKEGRGLYITDKGHWLLAKAAGGRSQRRQPEAPQAPEAPSQAPHQPPLSPVPAGEEDRVKRLEEAVARLEARLSSLEKAVEELRRGRQEHREASGPLPRPVIPISEASASLGPSLDRLLLEGRLVRVGSLVVDRGFLEAFERKFPIKLEEVDALDPMERALLEEMRREALVILHSGREYRLVKK